MNAVASARKRAPYFTTTATADVDVDIDPSELEEAGWVYVGGGDKPHLSADHFGDLVRDFHDDEHTGPMVWCQHVLCMEVVR